MTVARVSSNKHAATVNQGTITLAMPGSSAGNVLVLWATVAGSSSSWTCDNGLGAPDVVTSATNLTTGIWVRTVTSAMVGVTLTMTNSTPLHRPAAGCIVYSGASSLDASGVANGNSTAVTGPSETPTQDHELALTIGTILAATDRSAGWTGWSGSSLAVAGGSGGGGAGGVEFAAFDDVDLGTTAGTATGALAQTSTPASAWAAATLLITQTAAATVRHMAFTMSAQAQLAVALSKSTPGQTPVARYAKSNATWAFMSTFEATAGSAWN